FSFSLSLPQPSTNSLPYRCTQSLANSFRLPHRFPPTLNPQAMKYLWPSLAAISCLALTGCVLPIPSTSQRSPEVRGRVIDAATRQPVDNACVAMHRDPG